jgi:uncharacterized membrane protein YcaP (DUF421 family)
MWTLVTPWYELVLRGIIIYFFMFIIMRLWGRKHLGDMAAFDFVLLLFISEALQNSLVGNELSIWGGMILITVFILLNVCMNKLSYRFRKLEIFFDGESQTLIQNGQLNEQVMKKEQITPKELEEALREQGVDEFSKIKKATLESNGRISVIQYQ